MTQEKTILAVFDFDGTLTAGRVWEGIYQHHRRYKIKRVTFLVYFVTHMFLYLTAKAKFYSEDKCRIKWGEDIPVLFKGFTREEARKVFEWVFDSYFVNLMHRDIVEKLNEHKRQGHRVIILSGMFNEFLEIVVQRLGVDYAVGTSLEIKNGVYSGRIIRPLCFGENKVKFLKEFLKQKKLDADFSRSSAYADSIYDVPVLQLVGHPVATYPEKELRRLASEKQWPIIGANNQL
jgi:HAD superfamily hydrolase (TIGR01490 family)